MGQDYNVESTELLRFGRLAVDPINKCKWRVSRYPIEISLDYNVIATSEKVASQCLIFGIQRPAWTFETYFSLYRYNIFLILVKKINGLTVYFTCSGILIYKHNYRCSELPKNNGKNREILIFISYYNDN